MKTVNWYLPLVLLLIVVAACSAKILKSDQENKLTELSEYEKALVIKKIETPTPLPSGVSSTPSPSATIEPVKKIMKKKEKATPAPVSLKKEPDLEDSEGFIGRRPIIDPFRPGEKVEMRVTYFGISAGVMTLETHDFVEVNGRKCYHFVGHANSNSFFSNIYKLEDWAETFLDYEKMIPYNYEVHIKESKQLGEIRAFFDWTKNTFKYWERKITKDKGLVMVEREWEVLPYSQNLFTAAWYFRTFTLRPGKKIQFRMVDDKKNIVVTGEVLRREKLETDIGVLDTLVIAPTVELEGVFQPIGEVFFWLTDDDRKFIVQIQSKIKIGKIITYLNSLEKGQ